jgi:Ca2+-binding RTX toxin-like protein
MRFSTTLSAAALTIGLCAPLAGVPAAHAAQSCDGLRATIVGTNRADRIVGTDKRDVIVARGGNDVIRGGGGNDVICAGDGADTVHGGDGHDRIFGQGDAYWADSYGRARRRGDMLSGGAGNDHLDPGADPRPVSPGVKAVPDGVTYADAPNPLVVDLRSLTASAGANGVDTIVPNPTGMRVVATPHADTVVGTQGPDTIWAGAGDDRVNAQNGDDTVHADNGASVGNDRVLGSVGDDTISGAVGYDSFLGGPGADTLTTSAPTRTELRGGTGADTVAFPLPTESGWVVNGEKGEDRLRLLPGANPALVPTVRIDQRAGTIAVRGLVPVTVLGKLRGFNDVQLPAGASVKYFGSNESEIITAHPLHGIRVKARGGADVVNGSRRDDWVDGGPGFDIVRGKGGKDTCRRAERRSSC